MTILIIFGVTAFLAMIVCYIKIRRYEESFWDYFDLYEEEEDEERPDYEEK